MTITAEPTLPFTEDEVLAELTHWAHHYPSGRFVVVALAPDGSDGVDLGWGLALPDHVFAHLPRLHLTATFSSTDALLTIIRRRWDARLIWVDPEPERWTDPGEEQATQ